MRGGDLDGGPRRRILVERVRATPADGGADLAKDVSTREPYAARAVVGPASNANGRILRVAAYDFGLKRNILRRLAGEGIDATVVPADTPVDEILAGGFDGAFLSNGPGDPAATRYGISAATGCSASSPCSGSASGISCSGSRSGGGPSRCRSGHRGVNQPVRDVRTGRVEITSHNHGFALDPDGWPREGETARTPSAASSSRTGT
jgi:carbamoyl-phosphate synthase small subunit